MNLHEAREAIEKILDSIPDSHLPEFDRVELDARTGKPVVWHGGQGWHLGSATRNGKRDPGVYRSAAASDAIEREMAYRADRLLFENGDDPKGIELAAKGDRS